jgi:serine/threonine-protein kinase
MVELSPEQLAQRASDLNLVDRRQLESVWGELGTNVSLVDMQRVLLGRGILTNYQFDRLARGEKAGFFYGNYKVLYLVGTGSFARVYRAAHRDTGQVVALKVLRSRYSESPVQTEQFLREGGMGAKLRHPNVVPIYEVSSKGRLHFLVMEFVEGQNLRDFMQVRKKLSIPDAVSITTDITAGLAYAAERGITHRDMKLSNALIASSGRAQIVDFGLAAATTGNDEEDLTNPRTIDYAVLEKATGCKKDDPRSDIFFTGCMFYQMLCGASPIPFGDRMSRMNSSRFANIKPIIEVDPKLPGVIAKVVAKATKLDPEKRYQTQKEMLADMKMIGQLIKSGKLDRPDIELTEGPPKTVMIVESSHEMQDLFRARFKKEGYRALVMRSPALALQRFDDDPDVADVVIFSCIGSGREGLDAFNHFAKTSSTTRVPAILLLDKIQTGWDKQAELADHRIALTMPVKMRQLRDTIKKLTD